MPTFDTPEPISLRLNNPSGSIAVHATATTTTSVDIAAFGRDRDAADETRVDFRNGTLRVEVPRDRHSGRTPELDITVELPSGSIVQVESASADVELTGPLAGARVNTASGDIEVDEVAGQLRIETASGDVEVDEAHASVTITTASGDVRLEVADGDDDVAIETANGDIRLDKVVGNLSVRTASADIRVDEAGANVTANAASGDISIGLVRRGQVTITTASGDVGIGVADGVPIWLDLHSLSGDVDTAQQSDNGPTESEDQLELRVNTVSGDINVRRAR